jgi:hypothetical protein
VVVFGGGVAGFGGVVEIGVRGKAEAGSGKRKAESGKRKAESRGILEVGGG